MPTNSCSVGNIPLDCPESSRRWNWIFLILNCSTSAFSGFTAGFWLANGEMSTHGVPRNGRIVLTQEQAVEIYEKRPAETPHATDRRSVSMSRIVAEQYGVSSKTVRDIWNGKTWVSATRHLYSGSSSSDTARKNCENQESAQVCEISQLTCMWWIQESHRRCNREASRENGKEGRRVPSTRSRGPDGSSWTITICILRLFSAAQLRQAPTHRKGGRTNRAPAPHIYSPTHLPRTTTIRLASPRRNTPCSHTARPSQMPTELSARPARRRHRRRRRRRRRPRPEPPPAVIEPRATTLTTGPTPSRGPRRRREPAPPAGPRPARRAGCRGDPDVLG
jgi:hypothetical protein